ncbi:unnamed protein product [Protopolystoma xenopodis]|uniref:Uncharacterized protein n=1 Tax=Protopolystoma xenopodis TaxID=117903 RepID=A0A448WQQ9_9PLAT|nr:unnamed protein product [Protopolystoma xenopodis]
MAMFTYVSRVWRRQMRTLYLARFDARVCNVITYLSTSAVKAT